MLSLLAHSDTPPQQQVALPVVVCFRHLSPLVSLVLGKTPAQAIVNLRTSLPRHRLSSKILRFARFQCQLFVCFSSRNAATTKRDEAARSIWNAAVA